MPTIKQLNYLIQIVEDGSFTLASEKLFIAQSALSRQIRLLEDEIGFEIFDRTEKRIKLTKVGQFFYKNVKSNLLNLNHIIENSKNISEGKNRLIRIAHSSSVIITLEKIQLLDRIAKQLNLQFELNTMSSELQIDALYNCEIDIGLIRPHVLGRLDDLHMASLYQEALYVAVHQTHRFAQQQSVVMEELQLEPFVTTPHPNRGGLSYLVNNVCLAAGFVPKQAQVQSRKNSQLQLVAAGLGICIVPEAFRDILPANVRMIALQTEHAMSEVVLAQKRDTDELIQSCFEIISKHFSEKKPYNGLISSENKDQSIFNRRLE